MLTLLHLLSAVALLVWGTHIVRTGVMRVFGARLRTVLSRSVEKKPLAFCAGIGVTALVQSSNATTMLVTSFVAQDLVALAPALVIVLGCCTADRDSDRRRHYLLPRGALSGDWC